MKRSLVVAFLFGLVVWTPSAAAGQSGKPALTWLKAKVESATTASKTLAYMGQGDDLYLPAAAGGGMPSLSVTNGHAYLAGEISASKGSTLLVVTCQFKNTSKAIRSFRPLEVALPPKAGILAGAGEDSSFPFLKDSKTWARLEKSVVWKLKPGGARNMTYVFGIPGDETRSYLLYNGVTLAALKPAAK